MFGCTICEHRKSVLSTPPEFELRRLRANTDEMEIYGLSNYCNVCQRVTFFVNPQNFEGPSRASLAWNMFCFAAEKLGRLPTQDAEVQTKLSEIFRETAGQLDAQESSSADLRTRPTAVPQFEDTEEEDSATEVSETDSGITPVIGDVLDSETDSVSSHSVMDVKVLYRRQPNPHNRDRPSSTLKISAVGHLSARGWPRQQRKLKENRRRLEELASIMRRIEAKSIKLKSEMVELEDKQQQEATVERKSRRQRVAAGGLVRGGSWWQRENLERVFGKWSTEQRDTRMEAEANILLQAIRPRVGHQRRRKDDQESDKDPRGSKEHRLKKCGAKKEHKDERRETDNNTDWSMQNLYINSSSTAERAAMPDSSSLRDNEHLGNHLESPKENPAQLLQICRKPIVCPIDGECQQRCFVSDFNTHVQRDHQNVMLERIKVGQTKTFLLDLRLTKRSQPTCHMVYFVRDLLIDSRGDMLPVLVMTARSHYCDVFPDKISTKDAVALEDEATQFLLIWICSYKPTNAHVKATLSVEATCSDMAESLMVRTAPVYDMRAPQDMPSIFQSPSTLVMQYNLVRRITQRGKHLLTVKVKIE
ncbi:uncharacterized protein LOC117893376 [Drosophila subobscura]|uniref:uncharacterized protein LOC117893376 n=1 Tax=Drosophila subobscura TaxID=7241 RepID=UPI00155A8614|nr:uncharacterized protein LOC117893376 [Drosophila subobscura]